MLKAIIIFLVVVLKVFGVICSAATGYSVIVKGNKKDIPLMIASVIISAAWEAFTWTWPLIWNQ